MIECASTNTGCVAIADSVQAVDSIVGWSTKILDGQGSPSVVSTDMVEAVNDGASAIVLDAVPSNTSIQGMKAAKQANVPVVSTDGDNVVGSALGDVYAEISGQTVQSGRDLADYFVVASKGHANVAVFHVPSIVGTEHRYQGFMSEITKCAGCKVVANQSYGLVSQADFSGMIKGVVTAHPDIQYIFLDISQYATIAATALGQMGLEHKIGVAGIDCLPPEIQSIRNSTGEVACGADVLSLSGWPTVNELTRAFAGLPPLDLAGPYSEVFPLRLLDKSIIESGKPPFLNGFTPATGYRKVWGKG